MQILPNILFSNMCLGGFMVILYTIVILTAIIAFFAFNVTFFVMLFRKPRQTTESYLNTEKKQAGSYSNVVSRQKLLSDTREHVNRFDLTFDETCACFERIKEFVSQYQVATQSEIDAYPNTPSLSKRQECCSENAIRRMIAGDYLQALHEVWDVIDDYNKADEHLNFNEYVLLTNLLLVYELTKK